MAGPQELFDRPAVQRNRARAAGRFDHHGFLYREVGGRLAERLQDINRKFPLVLDLGCRNGYLGRLLMGHSGIERVIHCEASVELASRVHAANRWTLCADEEALPFATQSLDLVLSVLALHWVNDLPGVLLQIRQALKPDGLFLGALFGGETLRELRQVLLEAELEVEGGASPRVAPFADLRDLGALLQRAGLALPVADSDSITVTYGDPLALMRDLRLMGEANASASRRRGFSRRATLLRAAALYQERFAMADGRVPATFQVIYLTGWAPHQSQPEALRPGAAQQRLAKALGAEEIPAGVKARPSGPIQR